MPPRREINPRSLIIAPHPACYFIDKLRYEWCRTPKIDRIPNAGTRQRASPSRKIITLTTACTQSHTVPSGEIRFMTADRLTSVKVNDVLSRVCDAPCLGKVRTIGCSQWMKKCMRIGNFTERIISRDIYCACRVLNHSEDIKSHGHVTRTVLSFRGICLCDNAFKSATTYNMTSLNDKRTVSCEWPAASSSVNIPT